MLCFGDFCWLVCSTQNLESACKGALCSLNEVSHLMVFQALLHAKLSHICIFFLLFALEEGFVYSVLPTCGQLGIWISRQESLAADVTGTVLLQHTAFLLYR